MCSATEQHRDKHIGRDDEYSDSEDEGDEPLRPGNRRKNEHSYRDIKRPRLMDDVNVKSGGNTAAGAATSAASAPQVPKPPAVVTSGSLSSPLPPEPSPITPLPEEEGGSTASSKNKGEPRYYAICNQQKKNAKCFCTYEG